MDIKFHCREERDFPWEEQQARGFLYKDYRIEPHNHDFYEMNIILNGSGKHHIEGVSFDVKTGDVFIIPPMTVHAYTDTKELDVYHILMKKNFIFHNQNESEKIPGFSTLVEIEPYLRQHCSKEMFLHLSGSELMQLKSDLSIIDEGNMFDTEELLPLKHHTVWKILYWFSSLLYEQMHKENKKSSNKYETEIVKALEYVHHNYGNKITIDLLCNTSFLSRSTFLRNFWNVCKCTPMEYVNKYRCEKALEMMEKTHMSKTEIAHRCGFYDLSHMERTIKQLV